MTSIKESKESEIRAVKAECENQRLKAEAKAEIKVMNAEAEVKVTKAERDKDLLRVENEALTEIAELKEKLHDETVKRLKLEI